MEAPLSPSQELPLAGMHQLDLPPGEDRDQRVVERACRMAREGSVLLVTPYPASASRFVRELARAGQPGQRGAHLAREGLVMVSTPLELAAQICGWDGPPEPLLHQEWLRLVQALATGEVGTLARALPAEALEGAFRGAIDGQPGELASLLQLPLERARDLTRLLQQRLAREHLFPLTAARELLVAYLVERGGHRWDFLVLESCPPNGWVADLAALLTFRGCTTFPTSAEEHRGPGRAQVVRTWPLGQPTADVLPFEEPTREKLEASILSLLDELPADVGLVVLSEPARHRLVALFDGWIARNQSKPGLAQVHVEVVLLERAKGKQYAQAVLVLDEPPSRKALAQLSVGLTRASETCWVFLLKEVAAAWRQVAGKEWEGFLP